MEQSWTLERARQADASDPLKHTKERFSLPDGVLYLDGNSLGALAKEVPIALERLARKEWGRGLIAGWQQSGWMAAPERVGDLIAPLVGAEAGEVIVADTTTIAIHKVLGAALAARPGRKVVLSSTDNFPSDLYACSETARRYGAQLRVVERSDLLGAIDEEVAAVEATHVDYRTGTMHDLPAVTQAAHRAGALMVWDLCHSAGAVPVGLSENEVDLAVGCTYKYLNGGPGAPSFIYVRRQLQRELDSPLPGWLGHEHPFDFSSSYEPARGVRRFLTSSPPITAVTALEAALSAFAGVSIEEVRAKSVALTDLFASVVAEMAGTGFELASPAEASKRGSQVSFRHRRAAEVVAAAAGKGVIGDFRPPDLCRFGLAPLYLSYEDVYAAARLLGAVAASLA
jgi:kynureninase